MFFPTSGGIAQLGERLNGIQEVSGSIPLISTISRERIFPRFRKEARFCFLCGNHHNVQPFTELCKVNVEINVQLVVAESLYPLYQTAHDHFLCLYGGCVARLPVTVGLFAGFAAADTPPYQR